MKSVQDTNMSRMGSALRNDAGQLRPQVVAVTGPVVASRAMPSGAAHDVASVAMAAFCANPDAVAQTVTGRARAVRLGCALPPADAAFAEAVAQRAENLFATGQLLCAEAVLRALAEALGGPLSPEQAAALGTPFCHGMGGGGCTCGALTGAIAAVGLHLGRSCEGASGTAGRNHARTLHDTFREGIGPTCCRTLIRNMPDKGTHKAQCCALTGAGARLAAQLLLREGVRPPVSCGLPARPDTVFTAWRRRVRALFR